MTGFFTTPRPFITTTWIFAAFQNFITPQLDSLQLRACWNLRNLFLYSFATLYNSKTWLLTTAGLDSVQLATLYNSTTWIFATPRIFITPQLDSLQLRDLFLYSFAALYKSAPWYFWTLRLFTTLQLECLQLRSSSQLRNLIHYKCTTTLAMYPSELLRYTGRYLRRRCKTDPWWVSVLVYEIVTLFVTLFSRYEPRVSTVRAPFKQPKRFPGSSVS